MIQVFLRNSWRVSQGLGHQQKFELEPEYRAICFLSHPDSRVWTENLGLKLCQQIRWDYVCSKPSIPPSRMRLDHTPQMRGDLIVLSGVLAHSLQWFVESERLLVPDFRVMTAKDWQKLSKQLKSVRPNGNPDRSASA